MNNLIPFAFEGAQVRVIEIDGGPWFVAKDVAERLDYAWNGAARIAHVPDEWKGVTSVVTPRGTQELAVLSEQGLYFFLGRSDKPKALPMQKWVAGQVLPSIRKSGEYRSRPATGLDDPRVLRQLLTQQVERTAEMERRVKMLGEKLLESEIYQDELEWAMIGERWHCDQARQRAQVAERVVHELTVASISPGATREARCRAAWPVLRTALSSREFRVLRARTVSDLTGCSMAAAGQILCDLVHAGMIERDDGRLGGRTFRLTWRALP